MMFLRTGAIELTGTSVADGTGQIVLDNLLCAGNESRLVDCPHGGIGIHDCVHSQDAGVRCRLPITSNPILATFIPPALLVYTYNNRLYRGRYKVERWDQQP